jgi:hypothetical protein
VTKQYDDTNTGVLFWEDVPEGSKRPVCTGKVNVDGKTVRLAGWKKQGRSGRSFISLKVSEFQERGGYQPSGQDPAPNKPDDEPTPW